MLDVELRLPADVQYVGLARLVVTVAARQAGMADERIEDLKIAVSEATASAITAQAELDVTRPVVLTFGRTSHNQFAVTIDDGTPAAGVSDGPTGLSAERSLGVTLIRGLADDVEFRGEIGNVVHMRFGVRAVGDAIHDDEDLDSTGRPGGAPA